MSGTPTVPGWYINFQAAILKQLPKPGEIDQQVARGWEDNQASLKKNLAECLLPPPNHNFASKWRVENGVIYFSVISDGTTGSQWIKRLKDKGFRVGDDAKSVLRSADFKPTTGITTVVGVLKGVLFGGNNRITKKIRTEADNLNFETLNAEIACLIREEFKDEEIKAMGLWSIVTMHEPIKDDNDGLFLLGVGRVGCGRWLRACYGGPDVSWGRGDGFAFVVGQISTPNKILWTSLL